MLGLRLLESALGRFSRRDQLCELAPQRFQTRTAVAFVALGTGVLCSRSCSCIPCLPARRDREAGALGLGFSTGKSRGDGFAPAIEIVPGQHAGLERAWQLIGTHDEVETEAWAWQIEELERVPRQVEEHAVRLDDAFGRDLARRECPHRAARCARAGRPSIRG